MDTHDRVAEALRFIEDKASPTVPRDNGGDAGVEETRLRLIASIGLCIIARLGHKP